MLGHTRSLIKPQSQNWCHINNRALKCFFFIIVKRFNNNTELWQLNVINETHNHESNLVNTHSMLKRIVLIDEIKNEIFRILTIQTISAKIIFDFCISNLIIEMNDNFENSQFINLMFKKRDILNLKTQIRRDELRLLILIQTLIKKFDEKTWI